MTTIAVPGWDELENQRWALPGWMPSFVLEVLEPPAVAGSLQAGSEGGLLVEG